MEALQSEIDGLTAAITKLGEEAPLDGVGLGSLTRASGGVGWGGGWGGVGWMGDFSQFLGLGPFEW